MRTSLRPILLLHSLFVLTTFSAEAAAFKQKGKATYYADRFTGRRTTSGERYNPNLFTAAHRTLPFGTMVKVTNLVNGKTTLVKINDRGPYAGKTKIIDLSKVAAKQIGMLAMGVVRVEIEVIDPDDIVTPEEPEIPATVNHSPFFGIDMNEMQDMQRQIVKHNGFSVQLYSSPSYDQAYEFAKEVDSQIAPTLYIWMVSDGKMYYYRVLAGNYKTLKSAQKQLKGCQKVVKTAFVKKNL